ASSPPVRRSPPILPPSSDRLRAQAPVKAAFAGAAEVLARPRAGPALGLMTLSRSSRKPRPAPNTRKVYTDFSYAYFHPPAQARNLRYSARKIAWFQRHRPQIPRNGPKIDSFGAP